MLGLLVLQGAVLDPGGQTVSISSGLKFEPGPFSKTHLVGSGAAPCGPLNSSLQTSFQLVWPLALATRNVVKNIKRARVLSIVEQETKEQETKRCRDRVEVAGT